MDYAAVCIAVAMFGIQFLFNKQYEKECGSGLRETFIFSLVGGIVGIVILCAINRFNFEVTSFTLLAASLSAINFIAYTFCSLKAFQTINLSLYSLFAMLGGMILPFIQGIVFYNEPITVAKVLCVALITVSLTFCTAKSDRKGGSPYYLGVFVLNGMSGVITKIFQASPLPKASDAMFSVWSALIRTAISAGVLLIMLIFRKKEAIHQKISAKSLFYASSCGILSSLGNFLLLIALAVLPVSVQYPFVTGGVVIVSTAIGFFTKQKPNKKEILSVSLSIAGILLLIFVPI